MGLNRRPIYPIGDKVLPGVGSNCTIVVCGILLPPSRTTQRFQWIKRGSCGNGWRGCRRSQGGEECSSSSSSNETFPKSMPDLPEWLSLIRQCLRSLTADWTDCQAREPDSKGTAQTFQPCIIDRDIVSRENDMDRKKPKEEEKFIFSFSLWSSISGDIVRPLKCKCINRHIKHIWKTKIQSHRLPLIAPDPCHHSKQQKTTTTDIDCLLISHLFDIDVVDGV